MLTASNLNLAIDPAKTRAIVLTWPDHSLTWEAAAWLYNLLPPENVFALRQRDVALARNNAVKELCLKAPESVTDFLFMDRDMRPGAETMPVLQVPGDVVGCTYPIGHMAGWAAPEAIHMGLVRVSRACLAAIEPPWFAFGYSEDGTAMTGCECAYFVRKVLGAGFVVRRAGWCDHDKAGMEHHR